MAVGAFAWGTIADTIGRKKAFTATLLIFSIFTVLGAFSPDIVWFCIFRFMAGFGLGGCIPVDYALVGEFTPRKQRGQGAHGHGWLVADRRCALRFRLGWAGCGLWRLAAHHADHGAARAARFLGSAFGSRVAVVPDSGGPTC